MAGLPRVFVKPGHGAHLMSVANSQDERRSTLSRWVVRGLQAGEGFAYADPEGSSGPDSVASALADTGVDVDQAQRDGLLLRIPMTDFYALDAPAKLLAEALAEGLGALRIAADARHGLQVLDPATYLDFERRLADTCAASPLSALCQFDTQADGIWFSEVTWMHMGYGPTSPFVALPDDEGLFLFGEVDITNAEEMAEALRLAGSHADRLLQVDLTGMTLLTAAGCRALIEGTDDHRAGGGQVLLLGARPPVQRVLKLLGFDQAPGFIMVRDPA